MHGIDLRKLRYFVAVAEELHFRRAAEKLSMSQPPLSQHIQRLEDEIGAKLFVRKTNKQVRLTAVGEKLLEGVRLAVQQAERAALEAQRAARGELGLLRIGYTREFEFGLFPTIIARHIVERPDVLLELTTESGWSLLQRVHNEQIDIAFFHRGPVLVPEGLEILPLPPARVVAVLCADHPLAKRETLCWRDLADEPYLLPRTVPSDVEDGWRGMFFETAGFLPNIVSHVSSPEMMAQLIARGVGWSAGTPGSFDHSMPGIVLIDLVEPVVELSRMAVWKAEQHRPALDHFISHLAAAPELAGQA